MHSVELYVAKSYAFLGVKRYAFLGVLALYALYIPRSYTSLRVMPPRSYTSRRVMPSLELIVVKSYAFLGVEPYAFHGVLRR